MSCPFKLNRLGYSKARPRLIGRPRVAAGRGHGPAPLDGPRAGRPAGRAPLPGLRALLREPWQVRQQLARDHRAPRAVAGAPRVVDPGESRAPTARRPGCHGLRARLVAQHDAAPPHAPRRPGARRPRWSPAHVQAWSPPGAQVQRAVASSPDVVERPAGARRLWPGAPRDALRWPSMTPETRRTRPNGYIPPLLRRSLHPWENPE